MGSDIKTYPKMNETIKDLLRRSDEPMDLYILARIEELENQVSKLTPPPISPLTIEELRKMDGEDVWDSVLCQYGYVDSECNYVRYMNEWWNPRVFTNNRFYRRKPQD